LERETKEPEGEEPSETKEIEVLEKKEIRVQFDSPISHLNHIEPKLFALAREAVQALDKTVLVNIYIGKIWTNLMMS
jgi:hypothetical protein